MDGLSLTIGGSLGAAIVAAIVKIYTAKEHAKETKNPQPFAIEQSSYQAAQKDNAHDHENIFARIARLEQLQAESSARADATFQAIQRQLDGMQSMLSKLFEHVVVRKTK